jgi:hypothetical protein
MAKVELCRAIQLRHWFWMSEQCQFSNAMMQDIIDEVFETMEQVISKTKSGNLVGKDHSS